MATPGIWDSWNSAVSSQIEAQRADPGSSAYGYDYEFGDWLSGAYSAGKQAQAQSLMDAKEWQRNENSAKQQRAFEPL